MTLHYTSLFFGASLQYQSPTLVYNCSVNASQKSQPCQNTTTITPAQTVTTPKTLPPKHWHTHSSRKYEHNINKHHAWRAFPLNIGTQIPSTAQKQYQHRQKQRGKCISPAQPLEKKKRHNTKASGFTMLKGFKCWSAPQIWGSSIPIKQLITEVRSNCSITAYHFGKKSFKKIEPSHNTTSDPNS